MQANNATEHAFEIASHNARDAGVKIDFRLGNAAATPFADDSFDFIYCSAAFKNFSEPVKALDEMHRVLRPGGEAVIVDLRKDASPEGMNSYADQSGRSGPDAWLTKIAFRCMLVKRAYTGDEFTRRAEQSRFRTCRINPGPVGFEVRLTKR